MDVSVCWFILSTEGHLGCSQFLVIMNKADINRFLFWNQLGKYLGLKLLDHMVKICLGLEETVTESKLVLLAAAQQANNRETDCWGKE